jgi:hypothetical protein
VNVVYKFGWDDAEAKPFRGGEAATGEAALKDPKGICTDKEGNLFVADKGNDRVAVFKPDGSLLGTLKTPRPERVSVNGKTGAVYVLGGGNINELVKFKSWKAAAPIAKASIPSFKHQGYRVSMTMDDSAEPTVLWIGTHAGRYAHYTLLRIEDKGEGFGDAVDIVNLPGNKAPSVGAVTDLNLDREQEALYAGRGPRFNGRTGEVENVSVPIPRTSYKEGAVIAFGPDGYIYLHSSGKQKGVYRFDRDMKPAPFPGGDSNYVANPGSLRLRARGLSVDVRGNVYLLWQKPKDQQAEGDTTDANALALYGPDGKARNEKLIDADIRSLNSVRVDYAGNIYMLLGLRPGKSLLPPGLEGKVPEGPKDPDGVMGVNYYPYIYGSVAKFGP